MKNNPWVIIPEPNPQAKFRLFCLPYEGGSATIFTRWPASLPPTVEVCAIQLPGRGNRLKEPPFTKIPLLIESMVISLRPLFDKPVAFFGHGLGALISFELARLLQREAHPLLLQLFVSGQPAPQTPRDGSTTYDLPDEEFIARLRTHNAVPQEVLEHQELMQLMLPLLRADFELLETYHYTPEPPLACPVTAFGGVEDERVKQAELKGWGEQTSQAFSLRMLPGDTIFCKQARPYCLSDYRGICWGELLERLIFIFALRINGQSYNSPHQVHTRSNTRLFAAVVLPHKCAAHHSAIFVQ